MTLVTVSFLHSLVPKDPEFRFEVGVEIRVSEFPETTKKRFFRFPDDPVKIKYTKLTVESVRGSRNNRYERNRDYLL